MKLQDKREGTPRETSSVTIHIGETQYRITEERNGGIRINKTNFDDCNLVVKPCVSNEIVIV